MDLKQEFAGLPEQFIVIVMGEYQNYLKQTHEILRLLVDKHLTGVYVTANKPFRSLLKDLEKKNIDTHDIFFIDLNPSQNDTEAADDQVIVSSPTNLTELGIIISKVIENIPGNNKFLFFDSLSTLLIYNKPDTIAKFTHFLTEKMRHWGIKGVMVSLEEGIDEKLKSQLFPFCDKVIDFDEV